MADTDGFEDGITRPPITERMFHEIQDQLRQVFLDNTVPKEVRRRILEASGRATNDWHQNAIEQAFSNGDPEWKANRCVRDGLRHGLRQADPRGLEGSRSGDSRTSSQSGRHVELEAAWAHALALIQDRKTPKPLLLAAIGAVASIHPHEAGVRRRPGRFARRGNRRSRPPRPS